MTDRQVTGKVVSIVDRAASMLECFTRDRATLNLSELSHSLSLPKPTVFRIATALLRSGLLEQNVENGSYSLGFTTLHHAETLLASLTIRAAARTVMESLRDEINETIVLSLRDGDFRYNVDSVESTHAVGQTQQIGVPIPLYAGAASRVMLAAMTAADLEAYLARVTLVSFSDSTIATSEALRMTIEQVRRDGYASSSGEFTPGSYALACAIDAPDVHGVAALHVSIPSIRYAEPLERRALASLKAGIRMIEQVLRRS